MTSLSAIALSGMNAAVRRLEVSAGNVANQTSAGRLPSATGVVPNGAPSAYTPMRVEQVAMPNGGTQARVGAVSPAHVPVFDPDASFADEYGMVAAPNVDLGDEMIQQMIASYSFAANVQVVKSEDRMMKTLLDMKA